MRRALIIPIIFILGCKNPGVVPLSPGVYIISRSDARGMFGSLASFKVKVIQEANEFAKAHGKVAIPLASNESPCWPGHLATFEYQFKLVDPDSPEAKQGNYLVPTAPVQKIETKIDRKDDIKVEGKVETKDTTEKKDVYTELMKLSDLKQKGIITEEEFLKMKAKLLESK